MKLKELLRKINYPVPDHCMRVGYMLGGLAGFLLVPLLVTGLMLALFGFRPAGDRQSKQTETIVSYGSVAGFDFVMAKGERKCKCDSGTRIVHSLLADIFLLLVLAHVVRITVNRSYHGVRYKTWLSGLLLLTFSAVLYLSGTLLRWEHQGYETFLQFGVSSGNIAQIHFASISMKMFIIHVIAAPILLFGILGGHTLLIKICGISPLAPVAEGAPAPSNVRYIGFLTHYQHVLGYGLAVLGAVFLYAAFYLPPPGAAPRVVGALKTPWAMLFLQPLPPLAWLTIPVVSLVALIVLPRFSRADKKWDLSQGIFLAVFSLWILLTLIGGVAAAR